MTTQALADKITLYQLEGADCPPPPPHKLPLAHPAFGSFLLPGHTHDWTCYCAHPLQSWVKILINKDAHFRHESLIKGGCLCTVHYRMTCYLRGHPHMTAPYFMGGGYGLEIDDIYSHLGHKPPKTEVRTLFSKFCMAHILFWELYVLDLKTKVFVGKRTSYTFPSTISNVL